LANDSLVMNWFNLIGYWQLNDEIVYLQWLTTA